MKWFWKKEETSNLNSAGLSNSQIEKLNRIGDDFTKFLGAGHRKKGAIPSKLLETATRGEIRAGIIENLIVILQKGLPFEMQIKMMEATSMIFLTMKYFETEPAGGKRQIEEDKSYNQSLETWEEFQNLITRDGGRRFEINEAEIRKKIVTKLIEQTK